jgi:cyclopropane fatty-acyl-phospholipid synthase-like methyltransferase
MKILDIINNKCIEFVKNDNNISITKISRKCNLTLTDSQKWLDNVQYANNYTIDRHSLVNTLDILIRCGVIEPHTSKFHFHRFYDYRAKLSSITEKEMDTIKIHYKELVCNELKQRNYYDNNNKIDANSLSNIDQFHFNGFIAVDDAALTLKLDKQKRIFEIGSCVGGAVRYMAYNYNCNVVAIEIDNELHKLGTELTTRCELSNQITHICCDFNNYDIEKESYDGFVSWLSIMHISDRCKTFDKCFYALKHGGTFVIEDMVILSNDILPLHVLSDLQITLLCPYLNTIEEYVQNLQKAGFVEVQVENKSIEWTDFLNKRISIFEQQRDKNIKIHGYKTTEDLGYYYGIVYNLFKDGYIGGIKICGKKL